MKIVATIARYLLGVMFLVFGLNDFLHFIPMSGGMPPGPAGDFAKLLMSTHYDQVVGGVMVISAILLLVGRFVALGLTLLGPVLFNILVFHILMMPSGIAVGGVATILWFLVFWQHRASFAGLFDPRG
jgi:putative oxidoreductase